MIDKRLNKKLIASGMVGGTVRDEAGCDWNNATVPQIIL